MAELQPTYLAQLKVLRDNFLRDTPARVADIQAALDNQDLGEEERLRSVHQVAHKLAGAAGTFGFLELMAAAKVLENTTGDLELNPEAWRDRVHDLFRVLRQTLDQESATPAEAIPLPAHAPTSAADPLGTEVFLLFPAGAVPDWVTHLASFGFSCRSFQDCPTFFTALRDSRPPVAIIDDEALADGRANLTAFSEFLSPDPIPLIMLSDWPDLKSRIQAVRAGCRFYLSKPPDLLALVEAIETFLPNSRPSALKVLVVEDDPLQSGHHAAVLGGAGMEVVEVNDPLKIMGPLIEHRPDLILMDVHMPGCTGVELAMAIRQQEAYVGIPIVFVSQERARTRQLEALSKGGDDFLTKPVAPQDLTSIVETRALRGRVLRSHMVRDSLTGLLNHSTILDRLKPELARVQRGDGSVSFAMLDIDEFKSVNDRFGHAAGDRVLRSLARMLQQRLRKSDLVGRYGGEEFAVVLPDATVNDAAAILDDIRVSFAALEFTFGLERVRVTFSAGIAEYPLIQDAEQLTAAADEALYQAKRLGRNRIIKA